MLVIKFSIIINHSRSLTSHLLNENIHTNTFWPRHYQIGLYFGIVCRAIISTLLWSSYVNWVSDTKAFFVFSSLFFFLLIHTFQATHFCNSEVEQIHRSVYRLHWILKHIGLVLLNPLSTQARCGMVLNMLWRLKCFKASIEICITYTWECFKYCTDGCFMSCWCHANF